MCVDVLAAVGAAIVFKQVLDPVQQTTRPATKNHIIELATISHKHLE